MMWLAIELKAIAAKPRTVAAAAAAAVRSRLAAETRSERRTAT